MLLFVLSFARYLSTNVLRPIYVNNLSFSGSINDSASLISSLVYSFKINSEYTPFSPSVLINHKNFRIFHYHHTNGYKLLLYIVSLNKILMQQKSIQVLPL